ncbi:ParB/RepB/Spo0J family partition protein [Pseudomonas gingeri]
MTTKTKNAFSTGAKKLSDFQRKKTLVEPGEAIIKVSPGEVECKKQIRSEDNPGFTIESLTELGNDIEQNGQDQAAVLRPNPNPENGFKYEMVAGERRKRACEIKGLLLDAVVRNLTDQQVKRIQRSENVQREGLTQLELALALSADYESLGTLQLVADEWNKGLNWVAERLKYLEVMASDGAGRAAVEAGITADVATVVEIGRLEKIDPKAAAELVSRAETDQDMNLRTEVRTSLKRAKAIRIGGGKTKKAAPAPGKQPSSTVDEALAQLTEQITVKDALIKSLQDENGYLIQELQSARAKLGEVWKPEQ